MNFTRSGSDTVTSFQAALVNVGYGQLALRDDSGKLTQKWTISNPKCVIGSNSNCNVSCNLPGIAEQHALMIVGARQLFLRSLAPGLTRNGQSIAEVVIPDDQDQFQFEIAGHHFVYSRRTAAAAKRPEFVSESTDTRPQQSDAAVQGMGQVAPNPLGCSAPTNNPGLASSTHGPASGRLRFTFVRALEKNRSAPNHSSTASTSAFTASERPAWVEEIVRDALRPVESRLDDLSAPLNRIQKRLRRQARQQKIRQQKIREQKIGQQAQANRAKSEPASPLNEEWLKTQINVEHSISQHNARLEQLALQVKQLVSKITEVDQTLDSTSSQQHDFAQKTVQSSAAINSLQQETLKLVHQLQSQLAQPPKNQEQLLWQTNVEAQLAELQASMFALEDIKHSLVSAAAQTLSLKSDLENQRSAIQSLADRPEPTLPLDQLQQSLQVMLAQQLTEQKQQVATQLDGLNVRLNALPEQLTEKLSGSLSGSLSGVHNSLAEVTKMLATNSQPIANPGLDADALARSISSTLGQVVDNIVASRLQEALAPGEVASQQRVDEAALAQSIGWALNQSLPQSLSHSIAQSLSESLSQSLSQSIALSLEASLGSRLSQSLTDAIQSTVQSTVQSTIQSNLQSTIQNSGRNSVLDSIVPSFAAQTQPSLINSATIPAPPAHAFSEPQHGIISEPTGESVSDVRSAMTDGFGETVIELTPVDDQPASPEVAAVVAPEVDPEVRPEVDPVPEPLSYQPITYQPLAYEPTEYPRYESSEYPSNAFDSAPYQPVGQSPVGDSSHVELPTWDSQAVARAEEERIEIASDVPRELPSWWSDSTPMASGLGEQADAEQFHAEQFHAEQFHAEPAPQTNWPGHNYFERNYFQSPAEQDQPDGLHASEPSTEHPLGDHYRPEVNEASDYYAPSAFSGEQLELEPTGHSDSGYGLDFEVEQDPTEPEAELAYAGQAPYGSELEPSLPEFLSEPVEPLNYAAPSTHATQSVQAADNPTVNAKDVNQNDDGDESVEDYMRRLLARMRGVSEHEVTLPGSESARPAAQVNKDPSAAQAAADPSAVSEPVSESWNEPFDPDTYVPRGSAPEKNRDLNALRELANNSARSAIQVSARRRQGSAILIKSTIALVGLGAGIALLSINGVRINIAFIATIASFLVALIWGYDTLATLRPLVQSLGTAKELPVASPSANKAGID